MRLEKKDTLQKFTCELMRDLYDDHEMIDHLTETANHRLEFLGLNARLSRSHVSAVIFAMYSDTDFRSSLQELD